MGSTPEIQSRTNTPLYAFATLIAFLVFMGVVIVSGHSTDSPLFIGVVISTFPSLVAAMFAERASRDIRNSVLRDQVKAGTHDALAEAEVVTRDGPASTLAMESLAELLKEKRDRDNDG